MALVVPVVAEVVVTVVVVVTITVSRSSRRRSSNSSSSSSSSSMESQSYEGVGAVLKLLPVHVALQGGPADLLNPGAPG